MKMNIKSEKHRIGQKKFNSQYRDFHNIEHKFNSNIINEYKKNVNYSLCIISKIIKIIPPKLPILKYDFCKSYSRMIVGHKTR